MSKGIYISFDGMDGCGKSTLLKKTVEYLIEKNIPVLQTKQPGDPSSETCKIMRELLLNDKYQMDNFTNELLFLAEASLNTKSIVKPALEQGKIVLTDRSLVTHIIYSQSKGAYNEHWRMACEYAFGPTKPNYTFIIDCSEDICFERLSKKRPEFADGNDRMESGGYNYLIKLRNLFLEYYSLFKDVVPYNKLYLINNSTSIDEAMKQIKKAIDSDILHVYSNKA